MGKILKTTYEIWQVSEDGLLKVPTNWDYGQEFQLFDSIYVTPEEADAAIVARGDTHSTYVILPTKQVAEDDDERPAIKPAAALARESFHRLWTACVGTANYDKSAWNSCERQLKLAKIIQ